MKQVPENGNIPGYMYMPSLLALSLFGKCNLDIDLFYLVVLTHVNNSKFFSSEVLKLLVRWCFALNVQPNRCVSLCH